ncbi:MAG: fumarate reductase/succinate dehydrogenase flavoprotein subunit, partial [Acidobacteria bacterium]|nr:fumarate reductase/succinate dehydrogenase flavoprotein subunit [Acidobacteriota bacterium]
SDHGANRLGASALMQGLADGYFVLPYTIGDFLAKHLGEAKMTPDDAAFRSAEEAVRKRIAGFLAMDGSKSVDHFHRELGKICWEECGMSRNAAGLKKALEEIPKLREEFYADAFVPKGDQLNSSLEKAGRVADFFELAELMCYDALEREESCGGHFREEHQTPEGEAKRNDEDFSYVAAWEYKGHGKAPVLHKEPLEFEYVKLSQRSYK